MYRLLDTSDIPAGYINFLTTKQNSLNKTLSEHENVDGLWLFSDDDKERKQVINNSVSNLKRYWCPKSKNINWLINSMGDAGAVLMGGIWLMWISHGKDKSIFLEWRWSAFSVLLLWCIGQNILVEIYLYHDQLAVGKTLSWAPLSPLGPYFNPVLFEFNNRTIMLQSQIPWMILPWFLYNTLINLNK